MTDPSVAEPDPWAEISAELHRIADDMLKLVGETGPRSFAVNIQPHNADGIGKDTVKGRPETVAAVDAAAHVLLGKAATSYPCGGGFHHGADGQRGPVEVRIYQSVADPDAVDPDVEIARLRSRVAELEARDDGQGHSRADDGEGPQSVGRRVEPHYADGQTGAELAEPKSLFAPGEPRCGAHTPDGPCVLFPGHTELCEPDDEDPRAWEG